MLIPEDSLPGRCTLVWNLEAKGVFRRYQGKIIFDGRLSPGATVLGKRNVYTGRKWPLIEYESKGSGGISGTPPCSRVKEAVKLICKINVLHPTPNFVCPSIIILNMTPHIQAEKIKRSKGKELWMRKTSRLQLTGDFQM
jgi:hypothetical protein